MKPENLTPKGIFEDIVSMTWTLPFYLGKGKEYEELVKFICEKKYDQQKSIPPIKNLVKETGLSYSIFSKFLKNLYKDLREDEDFVMDTHEVKYRFWVSSSHGRGVIFDLKNLPVVPRTGESVELSYFRECCGSNTFYVKNIKHAFRNGCQFVEIELAEGDYNLFWHLRLDEAIEKKEVDWDDLFEKSAYQLKEQLDVIPKWYRNL
ncbi:MAG: hypothetical protein NTU98_08380 [Bacteroidetes bacterium]|nr:hypothetical protein [Bacteroidota bacterium]